MHVVDEPRGEELADRRCTPADPDVHVATVRDVEKLVLSATHGVRLLHAPQVPPAIPVRPGALYFALEPRGPLYERMLQSRTLLLYAPAGLPELQLELFALNDGQ